MPSKRKNGTGSVYERKDGRWVASWVDATGKRRSAYFRDEDSARAGLSKYVKAANAGRVVSTGKGPTIEDFFTHWRDNVVPSAIARGSRQRKPLSPATRRNYIDHVEKVLVPALGSRRVSSITAEDVEAVLRDLSKRKTGKKKDRRISDSYMQGSAKAFAHYFRAAVKAGHLDSNPMAEVDVPLGAVSDPDKRVTPTPAQVREMLKVEDPLLVALVSTWLLIGGRMTEVLSLTWDQVNVEDMAVTVHGKGSRTRRVSMTPALAEQLATWRQTQEEMKAEALSKPLAYWDGEKLNLVFTTVLGTMLDSSNIRRRFNAAFRPIVPGITPHSLRRAHATWSVESGASLAAVARNLGHSDTRVTERYIMHSEAMSREVSDAVAARLLSES